MQFFPRDVLRATRWAVTALLTFSVLGCGGGGSGESESQRIAVKSATVHGAGAQSAVAAALPRETPQAAQPVAGNVLTNAGFESGMLGWTETSTGGFTLLASTNEYTANTGSKFAWLGGYNSGTDVLSQVVTVPTSGQQAKLQFWYQVHTNESSTLKAYDTLAVEIYNSSTGAKLASLASFTNLNAGSAWVQSPQYDLTAYKGMRIALRFTAVFDGSEETSFLIDDVSLAPLDAATVTPQTGWWWNAAEPGRGFAIEAQGDKIYLAAFLYETYGSGTWYATTMTRQANGSFTGALTRYAGGQTLAGAYKAPSTIVEMANAVLSFSSTTAGSLVVQPVDGSASKTITLERFPISSPSFAAPTSNFQSGWWWNESQGGRGVFVEVQGSQAFIGAFMYDDTGHPVWYVSIASLSSSRSVGGTLLQFSGGQSLTGSYRENSALPGNSGVLALNFPASGGATMVLPSGASVPITRYAFNPAAPPAPDPSPGTGTPSTAPSYQAAYDQCYTGTPALYTATYCRAYATAMSTGSSATAANQAGAAAAGSNVGNIGTGQPVSSTGTPSSSSGPGTTPPVTGGAGTWASVSAGYYYTVAIKNDGTLWAWGRNSAGQLGDGTTVNRNVPTRIGNATDWAAVSAGGDTTVALKTNGALWAWGSNTGDGTTIAKKVPTRIGSATNWASVSSGGTHALATRADGTLWAWGRNTAGQLGNGFAGPDWKVPTQIGSATNWATVSAGHEHSMAIKTDRTLWGWGYNRLGQLGDGTLSSKNVPTRIGTGSTWASISASSYSTHATKTDGTLWAWGSGSYGILGNGTAADKPDPTQIGAAANWAAVSAGGSGVVARKNDGTLWAWGGSSIVQPNASYGVPTQTGAAANWATVSAGAFHAAALKVDGSLWAWGGNTYGEVGDGTSIAKNSPVNIP